MLFLPARINAPRKVLQNLPHAAAQLETSQEIQDLNLSALKSKPCFVMKPTMLSLSRRGRAPYPNVLDFIMDIAFVPGLCSEVPST